MSLEIFYHAVRSEIDSKFHAVLAAVHFALVNMGFKCIELAEKVSIDFIDISVFGNNNNNVATVHLGSAESTKWTIFRHVT